MLQKAEEETPTVRVASQLMLAGTLRSGRRSKELTHFSLGAVGNPVAEEAGWLREYNLIGVLLMMYSISYVLKR